MKKKEFVHLHTHSEYSLLDGLAKIKPLVEKTAQLGMTSLALTDHGAMYGAIKFYNACREAGIKPIIGVETYMATGSRFDKQPGVSADRNHLILLAKNFTGYQNLLKLVSLSFLEGFYYKPRIDWEILEKYHQGLIASSACLAGEIPSLIVNGEIKKAEEITKKMVDLFKDDFYLEIQNHPKIREQEIANKEIIKISRKLGIPLIASNDVHYINPEDAEAQDALLAIQTQKKVSDPDRLSMINSPDFYLKSAEEIYQEFKDYPDAMRNTLEVAEKCNLEIPLGQKIYPKFKFPKGETAASFLRKLTYEKLPYRYPQPDESIKKRVEYELDLIIKMGYAEYFLIVQDLVNWAKNNNIRVGPGRGSAAGSIVSYILRITSVDPIAHSLPFERFLNPERQSTPDIDLDFPDTRRDEVINYVREKYGEDHVAQIITFGTIEARMAVRDIARVLDYPYATGDRIAKMIPFQAGKKATMEKAIEDNPELKQAYQSEEETKKIIDLAKKIVGVARHASVHAAGVVISDKPLVNYTPLQRETKEGRITTQYDMYSLDLNVADDAVGLLKMDFLGLRNLTIIENATNFIRKTKKKKIDLSEVPLDDSKVYEMITKGDTTGVFQLESQGMRKLAQKLRPSRFSDLSAMVALFRPGPMQFIDEFIAGKKNPKKIHYPHPALKPILEETYGIAVYQEQCMEIPHIMANYTLGEADILRRAIGKKSPELMKKEKKRFIERAVKNNYSRGIAEKVFSLIERFASYGFNKAHSVSYAMIAYQTAWLKANYPVEFMAALLTAEAGSGQGKEEKISLAIQECRKMGIKVLPPDINKSGTGFTIEKDSESRENLAIRFGLSAIKNVGEAAIEEILTVRAREKKFKSLADFCLKTNPQKINKKVIESLIKAGAFDQFGKRSAMLVSIDKIRSVSERIQKEKANGQKTLFEIQGNPDNVFEEQEFELSAVKEFSKEEILSFEKQLFGFYLSGHPLQDKLIRFESITTHKIYQLLEEKEGEKVRIVGLVENIRVINTRNGNKQMCFASLQDESGTIDLVVFPNLYQQAASILNPNSIIIIDGKIDRQRNRTSIIAERITDPSKYLISNNNNDESFIINIPPGIRQENLVKLNEIIKNNPGEAKIVLTFPNGKVIIPDHGINLTEKTKETIENLLKNH